MLVRTMIKVVIMLWMFMLRLFTVVMEDGYWLHLVITLLVMITVLVFLMVSLVPVYVGPVRVIWPRQFFRPSRHVFILRHNLLEVF